MSAEELKTTHIGGAFNLDTTLTTLLLDLLEFLLNLLSGEVLWDRAEKISNNNWSLFDGESLGLGEDFFEVVVTEAEIVVGLVIVDWEEVAGRK